MESTSNIRLSGTKRTCCASKQVKTPEKVFKGTYQEWDLVVPEGKQTAFDFSKLNCFVVKV